ncbi:MAG TPA: shikimate dehydrogenase [Propionibacteriaceae bacterium]
MTAEPVDGGRRCAVLGSPIEHSLSPALHRAAYAVLGLTNWTYDRFEVAETALVDVVSQCDPSWRGLSLTMPLKTAVLELGEVDAVAALAGAGNTLIFDEDVRRVYNTDVGGLVWAIQRAHPERVATVTVLGAGATARSALVSATQLGAREVVVMARTPAKAEPLRLLGESLGIAVEVRPWAASLPAADLVVSTVTASGPDAIAESVAASAPVVFDAIYHPWPTVLAEAAAQAGCTVVNGLDLLVGQALLQLELMTGRQVEPEVLYAAGRQALA